MKMSIEAAMEIWKAGGGVAASEWQERAGGWRGRGPVYRRRPTPVFCKEYTREELVEVGMFKTPTAWRVEILDRVAKRFPKVRKLIVVDDPEGLQAACLENGIPAPAKNAAGDWDLGNTVASQKVWTAEAENAAAPVLPWSALAKRLAPVPALGS